jgi:hypothetical protein
VALTAIGGTAVVAGAGLYIGASVVGSRATSADSETTFERDQAQARSLQIAAIVALAGGAAVLAGGIARWVIVARRSRDTAALSRSAVRLCSAAAVCVRF